MKFRVRRAALQKVQRHVQAARRRAATQAVRKLRAHQAQRQRSRPAPIQAVAAVVHHRRRLPLHRRVHRVQVAVRAEDLHPDHLEVVAAAADHRVAHDKFSHY